MDSSLSSRLAFLREQADDDSGARIAFKRLFLLLVIAFSVLAWAIGTLSPVSNRFMASQSSFSQHSASTDKYHPEGLAADSMSARILGQARDTHNGAWGGTDQLRSYENSSWDLQTQWSVNERILWLRDSWIGPATAERYRRFANAVTAAIDTSSPVDRREGQVSIADIDIFSALDTFFSRVTVGILLRLGFVGLACWPLWLLGAIAGVGYFQWRLRPKRSNEILGVCDRNRGPFYSGIYGPFQPNNSASGIEFSCPGLACPNQVSASKATSHNLTKILRHYGAFNQTTLELVRIILAYPDYPAVVEEERLIEEDPESNVAAPPVSFLRTNADGTVERSSIEGLLAILSTHQVLQKYYSSYAPKADTDEAEEELFGTHREKLQRASTKLNPLARSLLMTLTPSRGRALASVSAESIAAAYLSIEAGKSLVFRREGNDFIQVSRFPHLQARAVLQSILSYHREYTGDQRMLVRQAILSYRRHGDFGRAFLPVNMCVASRALRDLLEVLNWHPDKRADLAHIVESDAHLEEIHLNLRRTLTKRLVESAERQREVKQLEENKTRKETASSDYWQGIPYRSVVLVPLRDLVEISLSGLSEARIGRMTELMKRTRLLQSLMNISARLPGFKRQTTEAERSILESGGITKELAELEHESELVERWLIVRRMLTRYNWLSTRIGDDTVPDDGLVHVIVTEDQEQSSVASTKRKRTGVEAVIPIRQRRYRELFGSRWETTYFSESPKVNNIEIALDSEEYRERLGVSTPVVEPTPIRGADLSLRRN